MSRRPKSLAALSALTLAAAGCLMWRWYGSPGQAEFEASGFSVEEAPAPVKEASPSEDAESSGPKDRLDYVVKEPKPVARAQTAAMGSPPKETESARRMARAVDFYYDLKRSPRFKNSALLRDWKRDFLSHPDLDYLNSRYQKDRDAMAFLSGVVRSPNFRKMLEKYLERADARDFLNSMAQAPQVREATGAFGRDKRIAAMAKSLKTPPSGGP